MCLVLGLRMSDRPRVRPAHRPDSIRALVQMVLEGSFHTLLSCKDGTAGTAVGSTFKSLATKWQSKRGYGGTKRHSSRGFE